MMQLNRNSAMNRSYSSVHLAIYYHNLCNKQLNTFNQVSFLKTVAMNLSTNVLAEC